MNPAPAQAAFNTVLEIEGGNSLPVIQDKVRAFAAPLGYDRFVLFSASAAIEDVVERIYWVEGDWFGTGEAVDAVTYFRRCPVTRHILEVNQPFFWTKTMSEKGDLYQVVHIPRGRGIHGVQIPIFGPSGLEGAMSLGGARIDASPQALLALSLVGTATFVSAHRLLGTPTSSANGKLSHREREILAWITAGRRQADIAATLGISARTVENHLRRIRMRLGVATTGQAIRIAIRNGDIES